MIPRRPAKATVMQKFLVFFFWEVGEKQQKKNNLLQNAPKRQKVKQTMPIRSIVEGSFLI